MKFENDPSLVKSIAISDIINLLPAKVGLVASLIIKVTPAGLVFVVLRWISIINKIFSQCSVA